MCVYFATDYFTEYSVSIFLKMLPTPDYLHKQKCACPDT